MRVFVLSLAVLAVITGGYGDEPSEAQMKMAFETSLAIQVRNALNFVAEAGGPEAVQKIRQAGNDRFTVQSFRKLDCTRAIDAAYLCSFAVDIELKSGKVERHMNGRFSPSSGGLAFAEA
jgi:hypothetical protein